WSEAGTVSSRPTAATGSSGRRPDERVAGTYASRSSTGWSSGLPAVSSNATPAPRHALRAPSPVKSGDRIAIVSPSWAGPGVFPDTHERGIRVLREELGLEPVEYPTTRMVDATPAARAADLMAAFSDPDIRAVFATIGGDDQLTVLPYLDPEVLRRYPKRFFG